MRYRRDAEHAGLVSKFVPFGGAPRAFVAGLEATVRAPANPAAPSVVLSGPTLEGSGCGGQFGAARGRLVLDASLSQGGGGRQLSSWDWSVVAAPEGGRQVRRTDPRARRGPSDASPRDDI
eukprot:1193066-Prorocentrum_minimum.AAC.2